METDIVTENSILSAPELSTTPDLPTATASSSASSSSSSSSSSSWVTLARYILIFLILAFLGFNIFTYLGKSTDFIIDLFKPILAFFGYHVAETAKQTIDTTATGTKEIVNVAATTVTSGIDVLENTVSNKNTTKREQQSPDSALLNAKLPIPDESGSLIQAKSKAGYCYIGEDRGFRSCIAVGEGDTCMSGDIFPTMAQCINPNLR